MSSRRQTPETLKISCFFVFGKAIGCPGCFSMSEGWGEQSESCHRKRWKLCARKTPANFRKTPANIRKTPANIRKNPQIPKWRRANIFRFSRFVDGPTWRCRAVKRQETPQTPEITEKRKLLKFSRIMNLQAFEMVLLTRKYSRDVAFK